MFAVASLMLVGAVIIFALPTAVEAAKKLNGAQLKSSTATQIASMPKGNVKNS